MTNRIKELANKAGYNDQIYEISKEGLEKFAELIVKEAYEIVVKRPEISTSLAGKRMLEHFGVE